ncbi:unnamed protein product [Boreogadus saida]
MDQVSGEPRPCWLQHYRPADTLRAKPRVISMPAPLCPQVKPGSADRQGSPPLQAWSREDACLFVLSHQGLTHIVHLLPVVGLQTLDCEMHKPRIVS